MAIPAKPLIIFDCDGVLIDSEAIYLDVEFGFLARKGIDIDRDWYVDSFMALAQPLWKAKLSDLLFEKTGAGLTEDDYADLKAESRARVMAEIRTIAGIDALLSALHVPACVASSTRMRFLPGKLERTGLAGYFGEGVFSGDMVTHGKPAPDLFLHAASSMGFAPVDCVVVEDSANGVRAGKAAGMVTLGFCGGGHAGGNHHQRLRQAGADHVVHSHEELADWLAANTKALVAG